MEKDLELLEQAFLLLGIAESDEQLEKIVGRFLCPVILKMSSEYKSVQDKVMELLNHVSKRLNSRPNVRLPMKALMEMLQNPSSVQVVKNFSLIYCKMGFSRLTPLDQVDLLPILIDSLNGKTPQQMDSLLQMYSSALVHLSFPVQPVDRLPKLLPKKESQHIRSFVLEFLLYFILMPYSHKGRLPPPGLSHTQVKRATGEKQLEPDQLEKLKLSILKLLCSGECGTDEIACHLVVGMSDTRHSITDYCENQWRQLSGAADYEHPEAVKRLLHVFLGSAGKVLKTDTNELLSPGSLRYRISTMKHFNRSTYAANSFPFCIQVIFESLFGIVTNTILRSLTMEFVLHTIHRATKAKLQLMSPLLLTALNKIVDLPECKEEKKTLLMAYTGIGLLAKCSPQLFRKDPKHVLKLMESLQNVNDRETRLSVQECLSVVAKSYAGITGDNIVVILEAMLLDNIAHNAVHARWGAAYCSRVIFPFSHVPSRYVSLLACGDEREEVREEGRKGLSPNQDAPNEDKHFPGFELMMQYVHTRAKANMEGNGMCYTVASGKLPYHPPTLSNLLKFLHQCLLFSAKCGDTDSILLEFDLAVPLDRASVTKLREFLSTLCQGKEDDSLNQYLTVIKYALCPAADSDLHGVAVTALLHTLLASPPHVARLFLPELDHVKTFANSTNSQTRESAARLVSFLVSLLPQKEAIVFVRSVLKNTHSAVYTVQHGSLVTLGYLGAVCNRRLQSSTDDTELTGLVEESVRRIVDFLLESSIHVVRYACSALGEMVRSGPFPSTGTTDAKSVIERLRRLIKDTADINLKERCVSSLGLLCIGDTSCPHKDLILQMLFSLKENKHIDLQFTVGEALSCVIAGRYCQAANDPWNYSATEEDRVVGMELPGQDSDVMDSTLKSLLEEFAFSSAPIVRQSACVWMLSVLKNISKHPSIQEYLRRFQMGFVNLLADSNDMIQEVASRGLVLVYELSDPTQREGLVNILVGTLMEGRKGNQPISKDSQVFSESTLGKTPTGSSLTTYKELCSLASDLNQPDLIYKFMHLANHNALWNSKKGAAFGMTTIASHAKDQLTPHLSSLVPRLFRYKYDPIPRIQLSMSSIWEAIVTDTKSTIELYYEEIASDLISNLGSNQWRNREASCLALHDLLVVYQSDRVCGYLARLWELSLRARDDIKETVRKAADTLCKSLLKVTVKLCESSSTKTGSSAIQSVLPVLLKTGIASPAQEVRAISLLGIVKIAEKAGPLLKPHIPQLVPFLLESMSSLEPQILNTWSLQLGDEGEVQEKLESIRVSFSKTSPMTKACDLCIPHVDPDVLTELVPLLVGILKSGVGLGTKVGCAQFLINVVQSKTDYLTPHAGKLLSALLSGLSDRSATVRKSYAKTIGHLVKVTKQTSVNKLVERLKKLYYESGDSSNVQSSVAHTVHSMAQYSPDASKSVTVDLVPLVFMAIHGTIKEDDTTSQDIIKLWNEVWQELVPNTAAGVRLYLNELMEQVCPGISAQSWEVKRTAANALSTIAEKIGPALGPPHLAKMLCVLLDGLQGRIWDGKEALTKSLKTVCESCSTAIRERRDKNQPDVSEILSCLFIQCKKMNLHYKSVAIEATGQVMNSLEANDFKQFYDILLPLLTTEEPSHKMEVVKQETEIEEEREKKSQLLKLHVNIFKAIGLSWPSSSYGDSQRDSFRDVWLLLSTSLPNNNWKIQEAILDSMSMVIDKILFPYCEHDVMVFSSCTLPNLCQCLDNPRYFIIRQKSLSCLNKLTLSLKDCNQLLLCDDSALKELGKAVRLVSDDQLKEQARLILQRLEQ